MKEVVVRQYLRPDGLFHSRSRSPELVIGGNPVELPGVKRVEYVVDAKNVSIVSITFIARLETIIVEDE